MFKHNYIIMSNASHMVYIAVLLSGQIDEEIAAAAIH